MSTLFSSIDLVTVGAGPRAGSRRIGDFGSRSEDRRRRQGLVCSQLAESSAKEVPEESSAGAKNKSSKSVLVVGATGGVGADSFLDEFESFCLHTIVGPSCSDDDSRNMWEDVNCMILIAKILRIFVAGVCVCVGVGEKLTPGQLVVASLMERGHSVRAIIRNPEKGKALFGDQDPQQFQVSPLDQQLFT